MSLSLSRAGLRVVLWCGRCAGQGQVRMVQGGSWVAGWVQGRWVFPFPTLQLTTQYPRIVGTWVRYALHYRRLTERCIWRAVALCRSTTASLPASPSSANLLLPAYIVQIYYAESQRLTLPPPGHEAAACRLMDAMNEHSSIARARQFQQARPSLAGCRCSATAHLN